MVKLIPITLVLVAVLGLVAGSDEEAERAGNGKYVCPVHSKPNNEGPGWNPPNNCVNDCAAREDKKMTACCCKECGLYGNGDTDCHCCETTVDCKASENLNKPNDSRCVNLNKKGLI